jgi:hypothetical protein
VAILAGVELLERFDVLVYVLGVALLILAVRIFLTEEGAIEPGETPTVRLVRRLLPVTDRYSGGLYLLRPSTGHALGDLKRRNDRQSRSRDDRPLCS